MLDFRKQIHKIDSNIKDETPLPPFYYELYLGLDSVSACSLGTSVLVYIEDPETFETATTMYDNNNMLDKPPNGFYSFEGRVRYFDGTVFTTSSTSC